MTTFVRTAGMVQGTPDWQLDRMYETESAQMWAEGNRYDIIYSLADARSDLGDAMRYLEEAVKDAEDWHSCEGKIRSMIDSVEALMDEIKDLKTELEREVKMRI